MGLGGVCGVGTGIAEFKVVIINFPKDGFAIYLDFAKIMFSVGVVVWGKS